MRNIYIHIVRKTNDEEVVLFSNLPDIYKADVLSCKKSKEYQKGKNSGINKRQGIRIVSDGYVYLCTPNTKISNSEFEKLLNNYASQYDVFLKNYERVHDAEHKEKLRFKHNITTFSSHISGELYGLIPQDIFMTRGYKNLHDKVENIVYRNNGDTASALINAIKYSKQISTEIDAYEYLSGNAQILVQKHKLHKILMLSLSLYYKSFEEKGVKIVVEDSNISIDLDYKSFTVILNNILSNIQKYILPETELKFAFNVLNKKVQISITMYGLRIEDSEKNKIFDSGYSGVWTGKIEPNCTGMGLYIVKRLLEQNNGSISITSDHQDYREHNNIPYDNTTIEIYL